MHLPEVDIVLSSSTRFAHTVPIPRYAKHIVYFHSPPRYLVGLDQYLSYEPFGNITRAFVKPLTRPFAQLDQKSAKTIHGYIANSKVIAKKVQHLYHKKPAVIYPFVDTTIFTPAKHQKSDGYFLIVSRLLPWKRIDLAILACKKLHLPLVIIGRGPDLKRLQAVAHGADVTFQDDLTDDQLREYYRNCSALIVPQEEDFGLTSLEAQACGRPVIAFRRGGSLETIQEDISGLFFDKQTVVSLIKALQVFQTRSFDCKGCRQNALQFTKPIFQKNLKRFTEERAHQ